MHPVLAGLVALVPSVGVGLIFWYAMRAVVQADRRERAALARLEAEADAPLDADAQPRTPSDARAGAHATDPR